MNKQVPINAFLLFVRKSFGLIVKIFVLNYI